MFALDVIIFTSFGFGCLCPEDENERIIKETKGKPKPDVMSCTTKDFLEQLKKVQLSAADLAEFDYKSQSRTNSMLMQEKF